MKIRFSIVSPEILERVRLDVKVLQRAVNTGTMDEMEKATERLLELTAECHSVELSESEWHKFLDGVRSQHPSFESSYLLPGSICTPIFHSVTADEYVLELPIDEQPGEGACDV